MDKGLDIDTLGAVLGWHAALSARPGVLAAVARAAIPENPLTLAELAERLARAATAAGLQPMPAPASAALRWAETPAHHLLTWADAAYPPLLRQIPAPPPVLFVRGDPAALVRPQLAVVGSRSATPAARELAATIARDLGERGAVITSGLAYGIDAAAHRATVALGSPGVAVLGSGIDRIYPAAHRKLAAALTERGALVSEFPLQTAPRPQHFPRRNRIIAGLCVGTLVVEAARRSGSISTATHALEQGREVFAVPGSVLNPLSRGCHALLRQGATLVESAADVLTELPVLATHAVPHGAAVARAERKPRAADARAGRLLAACDFAPVSVDELVARSGLTVQEVCSMLLPLELAGQVEALNDGTYIRVR